MFYILKGMAQVAESPTRAGEDGDGYPQDREAERGNGSEADEGPRNAGSLTRRGRQEIIQILEGPFSAVSKPIFASKYASSSGAGKGGLRDRGTRRNSRRDRPSSARKRHFSLPAFAGTLGWDKSFTVLQILRFGSNSISKVSYFRSTIIRHKLLKAVCQQRLCK